MLPLGLRLSPFVQYGSSVDCDEVAEAKWEEEPDTAEPPAKRCKTMPLPSNHYLLKLHFDFPRNTQYTIPFPIPPERVIQELELFANPAEQAYPGKQASTSTTRSHHASQLFWSASQLFWSVRSRQCLLFGLDSQPVVVCFCCLVCFFGATANQPNSSNKDQCKV